MTSPADLLKVFSGKRLDPVFQTEAAECGLACLAMIAGYHGYEVDLPSLRRRFSLSLRGINLSDLVTVADKLGLVGRAVRAEPKELVDLRLPAILHWNFNHFVVLQAITRDRYMIVDPAHGRRQVSGTEFSQSFTGVALELTPGISFKESIQSERIKLGQLWNKVSGLGQALAQVATLTLVLQAWVIGSPFFLQLAVDDVLQRQDDNLLVVLAVGFGVFAIINAAASFLRQLLILVMGNTIGIQLAANVARHLLKLPVSYFERRHSGDVLSRFNGNRPIQNVLTSSAVTALVDGLMALVTFGVMIFYNGTLSLIALFVFAAIAGLRVALFHSMKLTNNSTITAQAKHDSFLIETLRGITTLRLLDAEQRRHSVWQQKLANVANARLGYGRLQLAYQLGSEILLGLEGVISVFIAIRLCLAGGFSIGMIYAYMAYKMQFLGKAQSLADKWVEFRMLDLYLSRLGDIAFTSPERVGSGETQNTSEFKGAISIRGVTYRYSDREPWVLRGINLDVGPGEHVAIVGPSGSGKTTLLKVVLGLVVPTEGNVFFDKKSAKIFGWQSFRPHMSAVLQDDFLFSGSIAENIAGFDPQHDHQHVIEMARVAHIHDEILAMPMGYESLVGEMGSTLSGGQRQRVLLARALYRKPRILVMDEGTAHLDAKLESDISAAIKAMGITRIIVAHREETVRQATRVVPIVAGQMITSVESAREGVYSLR